MPAPPHCPFCKREKSEFADDSAAFFGHVDACTSAHAEALLLAHPEYRELVDFLQPGLGKLKAEESSPAASTLFSAAEGSEVVPGVYFTSAVLGKNVEWLRERGISTVVNCLPLASTVPLTPEECAAAGVSNYVCLYMEDGMAPGVDAKIERGVAAMAEGRAGGGGGGKVLVHCAGGVSRSGTVLLAFLLRHGTGGINDGAGGGASSMALSSAALLARSRRGCVYPNLSFFTHLLELDSATNGSPSADPALICLHKEYIGRAAGRR